MESNTSKTTDLSGFLDGIRARNLATIERNTALQVSELTVRLHLLKDGFATDPSTAAIATQLEELTSALRNPDMTIVDKLKFVGGRLCSILVRNSEVFRAKPKEREHVATVVRRFVEAAELAHQDQVTEIALALGEAWRGITA